MKLNRSALTLFSWYCSMTLFRCCFNAVLLGRIDAEAVLLVNLVSTWKPWSWTGRHLSCFHDTVERPCFDTVSISTARCAIFSLFVNIGTGLFLCCFDRIRQSSTVDRKYTVKQHRGQHRNSNDGLLGLFNHWLLSMCFTILDLHTGTFLNLGGLPPRF